MASLPAAPMWAFPPEAVAVDPRGIVRLMFSTVPIVAEADMRLLGEGCG